MFTSVSDVASPVTSPVSSPVAYSIRSPVSYPVSTPVASPSSSSASSSTNSPVASPSSSTTLLTGFYQVITYSDSACTTPYLATSTVLNTCIHVGYADYNKLTATSTYFKLEKYTDSLCTVGASTVRAYTYTSGTCDSSVKRLVRQDSSVPINIARFTMR
jgi:hypothetical protein